MNLFCIIRKTAAVLAAGSVLLLSGCKSEDAANIVYDGSDVYGYSNPIAVGNAASVNISSSGSWNLSGDSFSHDPTLIYADGIYYSFFTSRDIGYKCSNDGVNWSNGKSVFSGGRPAWWRQVNHPGDWNIWAPDVTKVGDTYYLYYCLSGFGSNDSTIGLASSSDCKKWKDEGSVYSSKGRSYNCIDPNFYMDERGNYYLAFGSFFSGIYSIELDKTTMKTKDGVVPVKIAANGGIGGPIEAPHVWNPGNGYYYLFVSYDKCCDGVNSTYSIRYGRSTNPQGPFMDKSGKKMTDGGNVLLMKTDGNKIGPGGQSISKDKDGNAILVYHYYDKGRNGMATLGINDIQLDSDNWIILKQHTR